jgi:hypothetical protein
VPFGGKCGAALAGATPHCRLPWEVLLCVHAFEVVGLLFSSVILRGSVGGLPWKLRCLAVSDACSL